MSKNARYLIDRLPVGTKFHFDSAPARHFVITTRESVDETGANTTTHSIRPSAGTFQTWDIDDLVVDGQSFERYDESMLPMFAALAQEAKERSYCSEYDTIARTVGAPTREEITALTGRLWKVSVPILTRITIEVHATTAEEAIKDSNNTSYFREFRAQRESAEAEGWGMYGDPEKQFPARITAVEA